MQGQPINEIRNLDNMGCMDVSCIPEMEELSTLVAADPDYVKLLAIVEKYNMRRRFNGQWEYIITYNSRHVWNEVLHDYHGDALRHTTLTDERTLVRLQERLWKKLGVESDHADVWSVAHLVQQNAIAHAPWRRANA